VGLVDYKSLSFAINSSSGFAPAAIITDYLAVFTSISYFSHRYFTTFGGSILAEGLIWLASKNALSVLNQRLKVSLLTPAASANSNLLIAFILGKIR
jgi:hypothetical protein